jgi:hypothetical protein
LAILLLIKHNINVAAKGFPHLYQELNGMTFGTYVIIPDVLSTLSKDLLPIFKEAQGARVEVTLKALKWDRIYNSFTGIDTFSLSLSYLISHTPSIYMAESRNEESISKRYLKKLKSCPACARPFVRALNGLLDPKLKYHPAAGFGVIYSLPGCKLQRHHIDYTQLLGTERRNWSKYLPFVVIIALEDNVSLRIENVQVPIPKFSALIMRADVVHQGENFRYSSGLRLHFYIDWDVLVASHGNYNGFISTKRWGLLNGHKELLQPPAWKKRAKLQMTRKTV